MVYSVETEQNDASPVPTKLSFNEGVERATKVAKGKAIAQDTSKNPSSSSFNQRPDSAVLDGKELLQGRKVFVKTPVAPHLVDAMCLFNTYYRPNCGTENMALVCEFFFSYP